MARRRWRAVRWGVAALVTAALAAGVPTCFGTPWRVDHLGTRALVHVALNSPELLTTLHPLEQYGLDWYSDELDDRSLAHRRELLEEIDAYLETVRRYDRQALDPDARLSRDVLEWLLQEARRGRPFAFHDFPVNQLSGVQSSLPEFMLHTHQLGTRSEVYGYVARVAKIDTALDQTLESMEYQEGLGIVPPRFVITKTLAQMRGFVAPDPLDHALYTHFEAGIADRSDLDGDDRDELLDALADAIADEVYPAYERLIEYYEYLEPRAPVQVGAWTLPDGEAYYAHRLRFWTSTDLGPDEIHDLGRAEVERIHREIRAISTELGVEAAGPVGPALRELSAEPRFQYPDTAQGRDRILADYRAIIAEIDSGTADMFIRRPRAGVEVRPVPAFKQSTAPAAYYHPPALDGSRPGVFFVNLRRVDEIPRFGMRTLAYHEAIPGHHFQIAGALEDASLPLFRRVLPINAYVEGWALYAEQLAAESGYLPTPYDRIGYLDAQLFRAARLVVDTGIHARRWTREEAIAYMLQHTGLGPEEATAEVERYIVLPGQACGYMIGRLRLVALRERARQELGTDFDLARFHGAILGAGLLPLTLLERVVDDWIAVERGRSPG